MWSSESLSAYLLWRFGEDYLATKIRPQMKDVAKWSLMS